MTAPTRYRVVVTRIEDNPAYDAERTHYQQSLPQPKLETGVLDVVVEADDWITIRSAVVGGWK